MRKRRGGRRRGGYIERTFLEAELIVTGGLEVVEGDEELRVFVEVAAQKILLGRPAVR